ncbi:MAG: AsnC family transcriptional regulator, partial [Acetivibrio sp.]
IIGGESTCMASDICVTKYVWKRISDSINNAVDTLMLSELVEESNARYKGQQETKNKKETMC